MIKLHSLLNIQLPQWILFYATDLLCMPIVLTICLLVVQQVKGERSLRLPLPPVLSLALFYSIFFEIYLPPSHPRYTADPLDVLMYFMGALIFFFLQKPLSENKNR